MITLSPNKAEMFQTFRMAGGIFDVLSSIEEKLECGGFCYKPLFSLTGTVADGQPTQECVEPIIDQAFRKSAVQSSIGGLFMLISFLLSITLLAGFPTSPEGISDTVSVSTRYVSPYIKP